MTLVRAHLRVGVATWLVCHVLTFATLVACDCCQTTAETAATASAEAPCHETAPPPEPHCEHMSRDGAACPMHRGVTGSGTADCAMSAACAPSGALPHAVLLQPALVSPLVEIDAPLDLSMPSASHRPTAVSLAVRPDAPPPRL